MLWVQKVHCRLCGVTPAYLAGYRGYAAEKTQGTTIAKAHYALLIAVLIIIGSKMLHYCRFTIYRSRRDKAASAPVASVAHHSVAGNCIASVGTARAVAQRISHCVRGRGAEDAVARGVEPARGSSLVALRTMVLFAGATVAALEVFTG